MRRVVGACRRARCGLGGRRGARGPWRTSRTALGDREVGATGHRGARVSQRLVGRRGRRWAARPGRRPASRSFRSGAWARMGEKYDAPTAPPPTKDPGAVAWDALDRGEDPTNRTNYSTTTLTGCQSSTTSSRGFARISLSASEALPLDAVKEMAAQQPAALDADGRPAGSGCRGHRRGQAIEPERGSSWRRSATLPRWPASTKPAAPPMISVLTEERRFGGSLADLEAVRAAVVDPGAAQGLRRHAVPGVGGAGARRRLPSC